MLSTIMQFLYFILGKINHFTCYNYLTKDLQRNLRVNQSLGKQKTILFNGGTLQLVPTINCIGEIRELYRMLSMTSCTP